MIYCHPESEAVISTIESCCRDKHKKVAKSNHLPTITLSTNFCKTLYLTLMSTCFTFFRRQVLYFVLITNRFSFLILPKNPIFIDFFF